MSGSVRNAKKSTPRKKQSSLGSDSNDFDLVDLALPHAVLFSPSHMTRSV